ncbi:MAG: serine/threonine protein kinase [Deltaproteobacteria bacterium]|nr:serine/threonine protein kinase [Deltaproteobacteria bacterium]
MARASGATVEGARWIGQTIAHRYRIERHIARGGMGDVFLAIQEPLGRRVAVKTFRTLGELDGHADAGALFLREAAAIAGVRHDNAVEIYDYGTHEGTPFLVMEWLDGVSLARTLEREGCLEPPRALRIVGKVLRALERAHELGMVHRDVKPENVMLVTGRDVKLVDFGLVKWDRHGSDAYAVNGVVVGSPRYMAPEQIVDSHRVDHRADLYAVGGLLVHALTGSPPFLGSNADLFRQHVRSTPPALCARGLHASEALEDLVERCLAKAPEDRFDSAGALLEALRACPEWHGEPRAARARESVRPAGSSRPPEARRAPRFGLMLATVLAAAYLGLWASTPVAERWEVANAHKRMPAMRPVRPIPVAAPEPTAVAPPPSIEVPLAPEPRRRRARRAKRAPIPPAHPLADWDATHPCDPIKDPWAVEGADESLPWTRADGAASPGP